MEFKKRLADIRARVAKTQDTAPMANPSLELLAASKGQSVAIIEAAIKEGITCFGENRIQEAEEKWPELKLRHPAIRLDLIGPLQTNKIKQALQLFDVIQTLDRKKLADELAHSFQKPDAARVTRGFYIQVNTGEEPQKAGVIPQEADALIAHGRSLNLPILGLMCIPPANQPAAPHFAMLYEIAKRNGLSELSMGMSDDFETAIRMGSTCIRLGRALFGERE